MADYTSENLTVLQGLEAVRKRPGMYIGSTGESGLHHLVYEVVDNSIDEAMAGHCKNILVIIHKDGSVSVKDDGRGIPTGKHSKYNISGVEVALTKLHAGGKFDKNTYKVSGGLHGVGVSVVNALSKNLTVQVAQNGKLHEAKFEVGKTTQALKIIGDAEGSGTTVRFYPDSEIFKDTVEFDFGTLSSRLRELAFLNSGIRIVIKDNRNDKEKEFFYEGGLIEYVKHLNKGKQTFHDPIFLKNEKENMELEVSIQYATTYNEMVHSFVNNINTREGGTHLSGFKTALTRTFNNYGEKNNLLKGGDKLSSEDVREGLTAIISIKIPEPQFEGQTKGKLGNSEVKGIVDSLVSTGLNIFLDENPSVARSIIDKSLSAKKARDAARKARELIRRKSVLESSSLPGKLADCQERNPEKAEIFIVEGDSAGGCWAENTEIALADGRSLSFKELVKEHKQGKKNYCYTLTDEGSVRIALIEHPRITKKDAKVIKVVLDNDEELICTPDHKFRLVNGEYVEAQHLIPEYNLAPLHRKMSKKGDRITIDGYEMVYDSFKNKWIFTHMLADDFNTRNGVYSVTDGSHKHHVDFNKLNNNPDNLVRMKKDEHLQLHKDLAELNLRRPEVIEKLAKIKKSPEFREQARLKSLEKRELFSENAKKQWENPEYKEFMRQKFLKFYHSNEEYRKENNIRLDEAQKKYWSNENNREKQSLRVQKYFENNPIKKEELSKIAKKQWKNKELVDWRKKKTSEQWTDEFRKSRKEALNKTYYHKSMKLMKKLYEQGKLKDYDKVRIESKDKSLLKSETVIKNYFDECIEAMNLAVHCYNHKIKEIIPMTETRDVYDLEVRGTHNFALAAGVFVHNSAKQGRSREFQAILPLRGKILNVERSRLDKIIGNNEINNIITALGTSIAEEFNIEKLRYHKTVIMCDADSDGNHIATLLLTFFFRHMREIIEKGYLYKAQPPLFQIKRGNSVKYAYSDKEKDEIVKEMGEKLGIQRYKGLGEMNPQQLWDTTMDPDHRVLRQITIEDAALADEMFNILMGDEVEPRRNFIQENAKQVVNLDV